eukprot:scpid67486/ scgid35173/ Calcium channel flower
MWDIAKSAVLGRTKEEAESGAKDDENGPGCGSMLLGRVWGSFAAVLVMVFGFLNLITCPQWAIYMMCFGFITLLLEASFVAGLFDCSEGFSQLLARIKPWQKAALYGMSSIPPLFGCFGITIFLACGAWFGTGAFYFFLFLGTRKKSPHSATYNAADEEAQLNLIDEKAGKGDAAEETSSWWPFSTSSTAQAGRSTEMQAVAKPDAAQKEEAKSPQPAGLTGELPGNVPPAFPEPTLRGASAGPLTTPYTGPPIKELTAPTAAAASVPALPPPSANGQRTVPYAGPLIKSFGDAVA